MRRYHAGCDAEDPTGESGHGPDQLLRAICILSMAPTRLLAPFPHIFEARRRAYELDVYTGGNCFNDETARAFLAQDAQAGDEPHKPGFRGGGDNPRTAPKVREFADAPPQVRRYVDPTWAPPRL